MIIAYCIVICSTLEDHDKSRSAPCFTSICLCGWPAGDKTQSQAKLHTRTKRPRRAGVTMLMCNPVEARKKALAIKPYFSCPDAIHATWIQMV